MARKVEVENAYLSLRDRKDSDLKEHRIRKKMELNLHHLNSQAKNGEFAILYTSHPSSRRKAIHLLFSVKRPQSLRDQRQKARDVSGACTGMLGDIYVTGTCPEERL